MGPPRADDRARGQGLNTVSLFVDHETLLLTREGEWLSNGEPITHERQKETFFKSIWRDEESGGYEIRIGKDSKEIEVEDTAYFVMGIAFGDEDSVILSLSDGAEEELDPATLKIQGQRLTCQIKRRDRDEEARFKHAPYHGLLARAEERGGELGIVVGKKWWRLS